LLEYAIDNNDYMDIQQAVQGFHRPAEKCKYLTHTNVPKL